MIRCFSVVHSVRTLQAAVLPHLLPDNAIVQLPLRRLSHHRTVKEGTPKDQRTTTQRVASKAICP